MLFAPRLTEHDIGNANVHVFMNGKIIFSDKFEDVKATGVVMEYSQDREGPRSIGQKHKQRCLSFTEQAGHHAALAGDDMFAEGLVRVEIFVTPLRWEAWSSFSEPTWSPFNPGHFAHFRWNFLKDGQWPLNNFRVIRTSLFQIPRILPIWLEVFPIADLLIKLALKPQYAFLNETVIPDQFESISRRSRKNERG